MSKLENAVWPVSESQSLYHRLCASIRSKIFEVEETRSYAAFLRQCGLQVGRDCTIRSRSLHVGIEGYLIKIGNRVVIEKDACCLTHDGAAWVFRHFCEDLQVYGPVTIEDDCRIGAGALICPGVRIGRGAVVAAGSVVINNVPPQTFVIGVPARPCSPAPSSLPLGKEVLAKC